MDESQIFANALKLATAAERGAYLDQACAGDARLRAAVEALLQAHASDPGFLEQPAAVSPLGPGGRGVGGEGATTTFNEPEANAGTVIAGKYKLLEEIGEGGMGTVWMAQQFEPVKRLVALKLIKAGMDSKAVLARFEAERQALALMDHPNSAKGLDAVAVGRDSVAEGPPRSGGLLDRPFFVMELVKGVPITKYCDQHRLTPRQRLELFVPVCHAIQHAHQKGVIHRDIKPSNVLIALYDDKPVPKVIDFGVAKATGQQLTEQTLHTGFGQVIGTAEYMSPEQASFNQLDIDTRSDIYSLGVLLYELLAGSPPFSRKELEKAGMLEMLRLIREQEPAKPSTKLSTADGLPTLAANRGTEPAKLTKLVRGELDWIVMKALEKDRGRRYETANGFAMDVQRYLADEPVLACPPSAGYRLRKFVRRNKRALTTAAALTVAVLLAFGALGWAVRDRIAHQEEAAKEKASRRARLAEEIAHALDETANQHQRGRLHEALAAVKRAEGLLASGDGNEELRPRVQAWRADLDMVRELQEAVMLRFLVDAARSYFNPEMAVSAYRRAFQAYGIDEESMTVEQAVQRIQDRPPAVQIALIEGLDYWNALDGSAGPKRAWRQAVVRAADTDAWRTRMRDAVERKEFHRLVDLAVDPELMKQPPFTLNQLGELLAGPAGKPELGISILRRAQQLHPRDLRLTTSLAWKLEKATPPRRDEALRFWSIAVALEPENAGMRLNYGDNLLETGRFDEAISEFRKAIELIPGYRTAHLALGHGLHRARRLDEAVAEFETAIRLSEDVYAYNSIGIVLLDQHKTDDAITAFRKAIALDPKAFEPRRNLSIALLSKGNLDERIAVLRETCLLMPDDQGVHRQLAFALKSKGQFDESLTVLQKAVRLKTKEPPAVSATVHPASRVLRNPDNGHYYQRIDILGLTWRDSQSYCESLGGYLATATSAEENEFLFRNFAMNHVVWLGATDEAEEGRWRWVTKEPFVYENWAPGEPNNSGKVEHYLVMGNSPSIWTGQTYRRYGYNSAWNDQNLSGRLSGTAIVVPLCEWDSASAIRQKPDLTFVDAFSQLGAALVGRGQFEQAITAHREALRLQPDDARRQNALAWQLATCPRTELRDLAEAITLAKKAVELSPHDGVCWNTLGVVHYRLGQWNEAIGALEKSMELFEGKHEAANSFFLAMAHRQRGNHDEARKWYDKAVAWMEKEAPQNQELQRFRAEA